MTQGPCKRLPRRWVISKQLMRSAFSVGVSYRAACRAQSRAAFVAKPSIVEEEADESAFWLKMLEGLGTGDPTALATLKDEKRTSGQPLPPRQITSRQNAG